MFLEKLKRFVGHKNVKTNIFRTQGNSSIMCRYFCVEFIDFMLAGKTLIDYNSLFSLYNFEKNDHIILSYFKNQWSNKYLLRFNWPNKFRLNKINEIKDFFNSEIQERVKMSGKVNKYIATFDYFENTLNCFISRWRIFITDKNDWDKENGLDIENINDLVREKKFTVGMELKFL